MLTLYGARIVYLEKEAFASHIKRHVKNLKSALLVDFFK